MGPRCACVYLVPSHVRNFDVPAKPDNLAGKPSETPDAGRFLALFKQDLKSDADADIGDFFLDDLPAQRLFKSPAAEFLHGPAEMPLSRHHNGVGLAEIPAGFDSRHNRAGCLQSFFDAAQIRRPVVDQRDFGVQRTPFVDGTIPAARGSTSTAWRIARAAALKSASTPWWAFWP